MYVNISLDNSLSPNHRQAIMVTNAYLFLIEDPGTILVMEIDNIKITFSLKKMFWSCHMHIGSLNVLTHWGLVTPYGDMDLGQFDSSYGLLPDDTKP